MRLLKAVLPFLVIFGIVGILTQQLNVNPDRAEVCAVTSIADGDTITCGGTLKIRFCGIDAPEKAQPLGQESRQRLVSLLQGKEVFIKPVETDRYGRIVGEVFVKISQQSDDALFINAEMVRSGMAYHYAQYSGNCAGRSQIIEAENEAKSNRVGVWSGNYQFPWDYRRQQRGG
jgi:endonuclease YncB( thermonuclease family)